MLIVWSIGILTFLGVVFAIGLFIASERFRVDTDPRIDQILELLPGANCGGCGRAGCVAAAEAVVKGEAPPQVCPALKKEAAQRVAAIMGIEFVERERQIAVVRCQAKDVKPKFRYNGVRDCRAAVLVQGGPHGCDFGCIGFGSCVEACPFEAMRMGANGLPEVLAERCTACGMCVQTCPHGLIRVVPVSKKVHVLCRNHDRGGTVKNICKHGCIACKKCEKACPSDAIHVVDFLAEMDYNKCTLCGKCVEVCPVGVIVDARAAEKRRSPPEPVAEKAEKMAAAS